MPLFLVATPIGNLGDLSRRAQETLAAADVVAAEDTRRTKNLLNYLGITTRLVSFYDAVEDERTPGLLARLQAGEAVALVSDAGTPAVADPGFRLVRAALAEGIEVIPIPGASAVIAALVGSGLPTDAFTFGGFVPRSGGKREEWAANLVGAPHTSVWFEAPGRIAKSVSALAAVAPTRSVCVARELTKLHEEWLRGSAAEVAAKLDARGEVKGEITVVVGGDDRSSGGAGAGDVRRYVEVLRREGLAPNAIRRVVSELLGVRKGEVFAAMNDGADDGTGGTGAEE